MLGSGPVEGTVLCPAGDVGTVFSNVGLKVKQIKGIAQWDNTRYGHYRGIRWIVLLREILLFPVTWAALRKLLKNHSYDIIHLNEATLLPWAKFLRRWSDARIVLHVRSLQRGVTDDLRTRWFNRTLAQTVDLIVAIDETVRYTLPPNVAVSIVHNGLKVAANLSQQKSIPNHLRPHVKEFRVGIVGVLLKLKGLYEFVEAARILINERQLDIHFYIVGENARQLRGWKGRILKILDLAHDVRADLEEIIARNNLADRIQLTGFVSDVQEVYPIIDLLCFPSYLDAAGRPVFEAAFYGVPSIVAVRKPTEDTIIDEETGICIPYSDAYLLADSIENLYHDRNKLIKLGRNARKLAERNFDIDKNGKKILTLYQSLLGENTTTMALDSIG